MAKEHLNLSDNFTELVTKFNRLSLHIGDSAAIDGDYKDSDVIGSMNSLSLKVGKLADIDPDLEDSDIVGAINNLKNLIDSAPGLTVTDAGGDGSLTYDPVTGVLTYTGPNTTGEISVTDAGGDGSLTYNSGTGVITYTGPSAAEVRAHFSAGTGIDITAGVISSSGLQASLTAGDGIDATSLASDTIAVEDDGIDRTKLKDEVELIIRDSSGTALKTIYGAGS